MTKVYVAHLNEDNTVEAVRVYDEGTEPEGAINLTGIVPRPGASWRWNGSTFDEPLPPILSDEERNEEIKGACRTGINKVVNAAAQANLNAALALGILSEEDKQTYANTQVWMRDMVDECRSAIISGDEPSWPVVPVGAATLASAY